MYSSAADNAKGAHTMTSTKKGIGPTLADRLIAGEPCRSVGDLQRVRGIGPSKAAAVWAHFCGR